MLYFRACPHCNTGAVLLNRDQAGAFFECLNCGWMFDSRQPEAAAFEAADATVAESGMSATRLSAASAA